MMAKSVNSCLWTIYWLIVGDQVPASMRWDVLLHHGWNINNEPDWNKMNNVPSVMYALLLHNCSIAIARL